MVERKLIFIVGVCLNQGTFVRIQLHSGSAEHWFRIHAQDLGLSTKKIVEARRKVSKAATRAATPSSTFFFSLHLGASSGSGLAS